MALRESRRDQTRSGVTSGSFDRRRAGALARGDVDAFSVRQQGDEKQYDLVLVLDRSSSMSNLIHTAEDAVARFALACEDLGINVAIIDFVHGDARLIKPFSVETEHVQASLMSGETGGGTPLTDALGLARCLLDQRRDSPLVIIITDGKPGSADDYQQELQQTYGPVCGLTLALDTPHGQAPERAKDVEQFYDRHLYVHDAADLDRRLDQFAVMFDGL
jgi:Mg-chelatase subunit ChlD